MKQIWSIACKELRGYFGSAVALLFLATFLGVTLATFFFVDRFFARNIADVRPLFDWLPLLLIFLVAALTMRLWSEEQKSGTLEILLTLPIPVHRLVLGKFLAGFLLVAIALGLTLGLPLTVAKIGPLDWGPVVGGYVAALLLASTYLAIGLCISSLTENQIVALIGTALVCGLLYIPGTDAVVSLASGDTAELLRAIGTGSRFESIARGVLDLRDLAYYASLVAFFLGLNTVLLMAKRWGEGQHTVAVRRNTLMGIGLVAANAILLNVWLAPVTAARVDLTKGGVYSLSDATKGMLASLDEPLEIRGYFSDRTHPLLAPLVPQIHDLLEEYATRGGGKVRVSFIDPSKSEELEKEAREQYNIQSVPFRFAGRNEQSIVNSYFHILVAYGDQYEVLSVDDLIDVEVVDIGEIKVQLGNLEYAITKSIRKAVMGFQSVDALFASLPGKVELEAYITPGSLPENLKDVQQQLDAVTKELGDKSGGKFVYRMIEPATEEVRQSLYQQYGFQPYLKSLMSNETFYLHLLLRSGERLAQIPLPEDVNEAALRDAITGTLKRVTPGFIRVVGLVTPPAGPPQQTMPNMPPQPGQPPQTFNTLRASLSETYEVRPVSLETGSVPDEIDVLLLAGPENLGDSAQKAVDQFLMRGGAVVVLAGQYRLSPAARELAVEQVQTGLGTLLEKYGVTLESGLVMDTENDSFPIPVVRDLGGLKVREIQQLPYPFFVKIPRKGMDQGGVVTAGLGPVVLHWSAPLQLAAKQAPAEGDKAGEGAAPVASKVLLSSSKGAWLHEGTDVQPDFLRHPQTGFGKPADIAEGQGGPHVLAVSLTGTFDSAVAPKDGSAEQPTPDAAAGEGEAKQPERLIKRSTPDARLVVIGSSSFVSDAVLGISEQAGSRDVANNLQLVRNLVDWALEDTALLSIGRRSSVATLDISEDERGTWEWLNYIIALVGLGVVIGASRAMRKPTIDLRAMRRSGDRSASGKGGPDGTGGNDGNDRNDSKEAA